MAGNLKAYETLVTKIEKKKRHHKQMLSNNSKRSLMPQGLNNI